MGIQERESCMKKILRSLCLSNGWSYGVFWRFDPRNHMLLTMEDAYYEEHVGSVFDTMILQAHMLGEGIIGESAVDQKHRWIFANTSANQCRFMDDSKSHCLSRVDSEFGLQFSSGIKTIVVIPMELRGVVQFGSTKEILEMPAFLDQAKKLLLDKDNRIEVALTGSASSSLSYEATPQNGLFSSSFPSQNPFYGDVSTSWANTVDNITNCSIFDPLPFSLNEKSRDQLGDQNLVLDPNFSSLEKKFEPVDFAGSSIDLCHMDELSQWLDDSSKLCFTELEAMLSDEMSHSLGGNDMISSIEGNQSVSSSQNSLSTALESCSDKLMTEFGMDFACGNGKLGECFKDVVNPVVSKSIPLPINTGVSSTVAAPRKGLFSELGLDYLLSNGASANPIIKSCNDDQWPSLKKRRVEAYQPFDNQIQHSRDFGCLKEGMPKSQSGLWADESYSMDAKSCISGVGSQPKRPEEPAKTAKKRARPGESTRPRPKDRQMIADRLKELRDLIPNGSKLSIDALLGRTVKHMLFLQSLNKHKDKLKQLDEPKLIGRDKGLLRKASSTSICSNGNGSRGATWAYEVGGSNLFCPIIVEDLSQPGLMLIEMLCEEQGYFLEIADVVRGFGLTIIKGVMESRNDRIWAHFIVEGNKHITRMDVFVSLMQLLQGTTTTSEANTISEAVKAVPLNNGVEVGPFWSNYQQHVVPLPI